MASPHNFLEDKFLDVGTYANAMELYKEDLDDLRDQLKIKVSVLNALKWSNRGDGEAGQSPVGIPTNISLFFISIHYSKPTHKLKPLSNMQIIMC